MTAKKRSSPWFWLGCGCAGLVVLAVGGAGTLIYLTWRTARQFEADFRDPDARFAKVAKVLGTQDIPAGYYPLGGLTIPLLLEMAMLSDRDPAVVDDPDKAFDKGGFIFVKVRDLGGDRGELEEFFEGRSDRLDELPVDNVAFVGGGVDDIVARGAMGRGEQPEGAQLAVPVDLRYVALSSEIQIDREPLGGLINLVLFDCPSPRIHLGIWLAPEPAKNPETGEPRLAGTIADESVIAEFMGHLKPCG